MINRVRRREVSVDMDKKILTGMIVSKSFCSDVSRVLNIKFFKTEYSQKIARWILKYFKKYNKAPGKHIKDIFENEQSSLKEEEADLIKAFLKELSKKYEEDVANENQMNMPYLFDQALDYFKERAITLLVEDVQGLISLGKIETAEAKVRDYKKVAKIISPWVNPFDPKTIDKVFDTNEENNLFKFPGALGHMIGFFKIGWLIGFMGPMKRGKSWWLLELAVLSILMNLPTVYISLEMTEEEVNERIYKRISALADEEGELLYPCFDCLRNQDNSCGKTERCGKGKLLLEDGSLPDFEEDPKHKICTYCRDNNKRGFIVSTWFTKHKVDKLTSYRAKQYAQGLTSMYGSNLRTLAFPINTTSTEDIRNELDNLEYTESFTPKVIVIDYADILGSEKEGLKGRERINETWLMLKNLAQTRRALVATGTQSSRKSIYKKNVEQDDTSEDIRKLAHVNALFTLNQTEVEEVMGVMRVGVAVHRHKKSFERRNVMVLYQLEAGQPFLDSEYDYKGHKDTGMDTAKAKK